MQKFAKKIVIALILIMPLAMFLSYHPIISLGSDAAMNFEINIAEIWLILFFLASLPFIKNIVKFYGPKKLVLAALIPSYFTLSIIWSTNRVRTLLTAGLFWLIIFAALSLVYWLRTNSYDKKTCLTKKLCAALLITSIGVSIFCWVQCLLDLAGVGREYTLLCPGCVSTKFGFPHPNGFAIEPQFMGNLLITPVLLCFYLLTSPRVQKDFEKRSQKIFLTITAMFLTTTLFLTFSRGAIYAFALSLLLEIILVFIQHHKETAKSTKSKQKKTTNFGIVIRPVIISIVAFAASLTAQGIFASISTTSDTFFSGIAKSIHQLSLGKIDFRPTENSISSPNTAEDSALANNTASQFSGYVAESTDTRLNLNQIAIRTWKSKPQYLLLGTGLGGAGVAMNQAYPEELGPKEIVQNEYVSLLLETGLLGCLLILAVAIIIIRFLCQSSKNCLFPLFVSVVLAFAITLFFFSGLPNAIHIYLFPIIFIGLNSAKNNTVIK